MVVTSAKAGDMTCSQVVEWLEAFPVLLVLGTGHGLGREVLAAADGALRAIRFLGVWPVFLAGGLAFCTASLFVERPLLSSVLGVVGFSLLWSIRELKQQTRRVEKGWFPRNPKRVPKE